MTHLSHAALILPVEDVKGSIFFYERFMGFSVYYTYGKPVTYAVMKRDGITINLVLGKKLPMSPHPNLYVFCSQIESLHEELKNKGVTIVEPLAESDYHMKEFIIKDTNGYKLIFGENKNEAKT